MAGGMAGMITAVVVIVNSSVLDTLFLLAWQQSLRVLSQIEESEGSLPSSLFILHVGVILRGFVNEKLRQCGVTPSF